MLVYYVFAIETLPPSFFTTSCNAREKEPVERSSIFNVSIQRMCVFVFAAFASVRCPFDFRHVALNLSIKNIIIVGLVCMDYTYLFHTSSALPSPSTPATV